MCELPVVLDFKLQKIFCTLNVIAYIMIPQLDCVRIEMYTRTTASEQKLYEQKI